MFKKTFLGDDCCVIGLSHYHLDYHNSKKFVQHDAKVLFSVFSGAQYYMISEHDIRMGALCHLSICWLESQVLLFASNHQTFIVHCKCFTHKLEPTRFA